MPLKETKKHIKSENSSLISIITPLYNAAPFISQTIVSIQAQTYCNWELIIIDDASTDDSLEIARSFCEEDNRISLESFTENKGAAHCRNYATHLAKGDFIAFLDADDLWHPEKLEKQLQFMKSTNSDVSYTSYLHIDENGQSLNKRIIALPQLSYLKQHKNNYIGNLTGMYNVKTIGKIEAPNIRKRQDWAVWLEAIKRSGKPAMGLQEDLSYYRVRPHSMSSNKLKLIRHNYSFYRTYLGYSPLKAIYHLLVFFKEYFFIRPGYIEKL